MIILKLKNVLSVAIALTLAGCGESPSDNEVSGIGGSGYVSSGSISNFGSVFVNGVEFETDTALFDIDGLPGTQSDLGIGMIVNVEGTINEDGITGTATGISFDDQLQGPVTDLTVPDADGVIRSFMVLGVNVIIDSSSTIFDISDDDGVQVDTVFDFDTITNDNNVEISGFFDTNGNLIATRVELKAVSFDASSLVEIRGTVENLNNTSFMLSGMIVDASSAILDDLPNGLVDGQLVEVKGTYATGSNTITATRVEGEDDSVVDTDEVEVEGIIVNYVSDSDFTVNGIAVDASSAIHEPTTLTLTNDVRVEVEGAIVNGILIASEVQLRGGNAKVHAKVTAVDLVASTFEVQPVSSQPAITITVTTSTQLEDDVNDIESFTLNNLVANTDFVDVRGYDDGAGGITAVEVQVKSADEVIVQGVIQSGATEGTVKVFGIEFTIEYPGQTGFENANDDVITQAEFFDAVMLDSTLIRVKDADDDGIADGVEIETP